MKNETPPTGKLIHQVSDTGRDELEELKHRLRIAPANAEVRLLLAHKLAAHSLWDEALTELGVIISADANNLCARKFREELRERISRKAS